MTAELRIHIWDPTTVGEDVLKTFFHNVMGHKYWGGIANSWTISRRQSEEAKIKAKYDKESFQLIRDMPSFVCGTTGYNKMGREEYMMKQYLKAFEDCPCLVTNELVEKCSFDPKLQEFLKSYINTGKQAVSVIW